MSSQKAFQFPYIVGLHDTDAADYLFSANLIRICHIAYEAMMASLGFPLGSLLKQRDFALPIVHIEGDFKQRLTVSDELTISAWVSRLGGSSYTISYELRKPDGELCATASTVQVCVDWNSSKSQPLPAPLREALGRYSEA
ncbi:acyl-CoA thioesterase [bacterium]|nr:acyl-CoA thioesterase [bacterium]MBU1636567.1 acyl-CoA thioesterase [bacterium]